MSTSLPSPGQSSSTAHTSPIASDPHQQQSSKPQRVLACVLCQQRKVKCDRQFPCANCTKTGVQCMPASQVRRPRKRRFPERQLLDRLRSYEKLLRENNVDFEPLHKDTALGPRPGSASALAAHDSDNEPDRPSPSTTDTPRDGGVKDFWMALNRGLRGDEPDSDSTFEDHHERRVMQVWEDAVGKNDHLFFGSGKIDFDANQLHPEPGQIFRLWQIYLDNVDPLLKVTHNPSLQSRIAEAVSNLAGIDPVQEALMFSIYCISVASLEDDACQAMFGSARDELLSRYQVGCQQALKNSGYLHTSDRSCLTAIFLYLVSIGRNAHPRGMSSMLGVPVRIAQRMGMDNEAVNANCTPFEAELRRRLWWALSVFDNRISELARHRPSTLSQAWDCAVPLNVNDAELRPEMVTIPSQQKTPTDALYVAVRCEIADAVRHSESHLAYTATGAKSAVAGRSVHTSVFTDLQRRIEDKYLRFCSSENPLHFMTVWSAKGNVARHRLVEYYWLYSGSNAALEQPQRDNAFSDAIVMLESDIKLMNSSLTTGFVWLLNLNFPMVAYLHLFQDLKRRPTSDHARRAWDAISESYESRMRSFGGDRSPFFSMFSSIILKAWRFSESAFKEAGESYTIPGIVASIHRELPQYQDKSPDTSLEDSTTDVSFNSPDFPMSMSAGFGGQDILYGLGWPNLPAMPATVPGPAVPFDFDVSQMNWAAMDWGTGERRGW